MPLDPFQILDSMNEGVYITDLDRRILYWNKSAERITGWPAERVIGSRCRDNILNHVDRFGNRLCVDTHCPLLHAMHCGERVEGQTLVFANGADGERIPMLVTTAPYLGPDGTTAGGIEVFREMRDLLMDLETAEQIQRDLVCGLPAPDKAIAFHAFYHQHDFVGGDFYRADKLEGGLYPLLIGDVAGHGLASGLYTMLLRSLWDEYRHLLADPAAFLAAANDRLGSVLQEDYHFVTALFGVFDTRRRTFTYGNAGAPDFLHLRASGELVAHGERVGPLGTLEAGNLKTVTIAVDPGDAFVFCTDGAYEVFNGKDVMFGVSNLNDLVRSLPGYGSPDEFFAAIEAALHAFSGNYHLPDDLTIVLASLPRA